jgi:hypothetical protein
MTFIPRLLKFFKRYYGCHPNEHEIEINHFSFKNGKWVVKKLKDDVNDETETGHPGLNY